jgi:nitroreductase
MDALECLATRRSIRHFLDIPVDQETMLTIVEAGTCAPSSGNLQDWRFVLVDDKEILKKISEYSLGQPCLQNAAFAIVSCSDPEQTERQYGLRGERLYSLQNCAAACENMLLAAHAMGLGGVWVGAFDENKLKGILNIPPNVRPQAILAFGYPAETPVNKIMRDLALVAYFNSYGTKVKNIHRLLKDYHVDWEKRISQAHTAFERVKGKAIEAGKEAREQARSKGGSFFSKIKEQISAKQKKR